MSSTLDKIYFSVSVFFVLMISFDIVYIITTKHIFSYVLFAFLIILQFVITYIYYTQKRPLKVKTK